MVLFMVNTCIIHNRALVSTCSTFNSYIKEIGIFTLCLYALFDHCHFLYSPFAYMDPLHCNMAYLYLELLKDSLNEYAYAAELAGLNYDLQNTVYGMYVSIHSPSPLRFIPDLMFPSFYLPQIGPLWLSQASVDR